MYPQAQGQNRGVSFVLSGCVFQPRFRPPGNIKPPVSLGLYANMRGTHDSGGYVDRRGLCINHRKKRSEADRDSSDLEAVVSDVLRVNRPRLVIPAQKQRKQSLPYVEFSNPSPLQLYIITYSIFGFC